MISYLFQQKYMELNFTTEQLKSIYSFLGTLKNTISTDKFINIIGHIHCFDLSSFFHKNKLTPNKFKILLNYYFNNNYTWPKCVVCNKAHFRVDRKTLKAYCYDRKCVVAYSIVLRKQTNKEKYGEEHITKSRHFIEKRKITYLKNYDVENITQSSYFKQKSKETLMRNYGVDHNSKSSKYKENFKKTCLKNLGVPNPFLSEEIRLKSKMTLYNNSGYFHNFKDPTIKENRKQTWLKNWGTERPMQNPKLHDRMSKSSKKRKPYTLNGIVYKVQGYEPQCLDYLLNIEKIDPTDIILRHCDGKPTVKYFDTLQNKNRIYFPDIFIKSQNRIIEVKSIRTYEWGKINNLEKISACLNLGYLANIYVMNGDSSLNLKI